MPSRILIQSSSWTTLSRSTRSSLNDFGGLSSQVRSCCWRTTTWPGVLETHIERFIDHHNNHRYHESLDNLTPAVVYFGRDQAILLERARIKRKTIAKKTLA